MRVRRRETTLLFVALLLAGSGARLRAAEVDAALARVDAGGGRIDWTPNVEYGCLQLTVSGPEGTLQTLFKAGERPSLTLPVGARDGAYRWELSRSPKACQASQGEAATAEAEAATRAVAAGPGASAPREDENGRARSRAPRPALVGPAVQAGHFNVQNGTIQLPTSAPEPKGRNGR